jgi:hypothetical protein
MKIGNLKITWSQRSTPPVRVDPDGIDRIGAFAVPDTEAWWLAVHETINEAEAETVAGARTRAQKNLHYAAISAIGAGEGCDLIRQKLIDKRNLALEGVKIYAEGNQGSQTL